MSFVRDVLYALRQIRRQPGLPLVVVLSLGLAMGISTSLFSVVNGSLFRPWPVPRANELRVVRSYISIDEWRYWREHARSISGIAAGAGSGSWRLGGNRMSLEFVSSNYFQVLQSPILVGSGFSPQDDAGTAAGVVAIISHEMWQKRFAADPNIVGRTIALDPLNSLDRSRKSISLTIAGVAAPGFDGVGSIRSQLWLPLSAWAHFVQLPKSSAGKTPHVTTFVRLAQGVSDAQAQAELSVLSQRLHPPGSTSRPEIALRTTDPYSQSPASPQSRATLTSMLIGIAFITLIACANVSNLLLARGHARRAEIALRLSLGASRARVIRQFLIESSLLSVAAAWFGVMMAFWLPEAVLRRLVESASSELAAMIRLDFPLDHRVLLWALAMTVTACVGFGLAPALRCTEVGLSHLLKDTHGVSKRALMPSLLSYQTIVSVMALAIAGLMLRSGPVSEARSIGRAVSRLTVVRVDVPQSVSGAERQRLVSQISEELAAAYSQPVAGLTGQIQPGVNQTVRVTPEYFDLMRTPWVAGRAFTRDDPGDAVMVVNDAFARRFWPGRDAIGQTLNANQGDVWDNNLFRRRVIGIVGNAQLSRPTAYVPPAPDSIRTFLMRAPYAHMQREAASRIAKLNPAVTVEVVSGSTWMAPVVGPLSFTAWVIVGFGAAALVLGSIGFFSLLDYAVQHRTREIGIRRALGAHTWDVVRALVEPTTRPLIRGLLIGTAGAIGAGAFMRRVDLPAGVNPLDALTYVFVAAALIVAAVLASYGPARRALRIAPAEALRAD